MAGPIERVGAGLASYAGRRDLLLRAVAISLVAQACVMFAAYALARALGLHVGVGLLATCIPVALLATAAPTTINGLGVRESVFRVLLVPAGVAADRAVAFSLMTVIADGDRLAPRRGRLDRHAPSRSRRGAGLARGALGDQRLTPRDTDAGPPDGPCAAQACDSVLVCSAQVHVHEEPEVIDPRVHLRLGMAGREMHSRFRWMARIRAIRMYPDRRDFVSADELSQAVCGPAVAGRLAR